MRVEGVLLEDGRGGERVPRAPAGGCRVPKIVQMHKWVQTYIPLVNRVSEAARRVSEHELAPSSSVYVPWGRWLMAARLFKAAHVAFVCVV